MDTEDRVWLRYCDIPRENGEKQGIQTSAYSYYVRVLLYIRKHKKKQR